MILVFRSLIYLRERKTIWTKHSYATKSWGGECGFFNP